MQERFGAAVACAFAVFLFAASAAVHASSMLRVGNQVLSAGDSEERAIDLLGKPSSRSGGRSGSHGHAARNRSAAGGSEQQLHFRHDGHYITVTVIDGRVSEIEDRTR